MPAFSFMVKDMITGSPLAGAKVQILTDTTVIDTKVSDSDGNVTTADIADGVYDILISKDGYQPGSYTREALAGSLVKLADVQLTPYFTGARLYGQKPDNAWQPVSTNGTGALVVTDVAAGAAQQGKCYVVDTGMQNIPSCGYMAVQVENSAGSGKILEIRQVTGAHTDVGLANFTPTVDLLGGTSFTGGTVLVPRNTYLGGVASSVAARWISQVSDPLTGGYLMWTYVSISGTLELNYNGFIVVPSGSFLILRVKNNVNQQNQFAVTISWLESAG